MARGTAATAEDCQQSFSTAGYIIGERLRPFRPRRWATTSTRNGPANPNSEGSGPATPTLVPQALRGTTSSRHIATPARPTICASLLRPPWRVCLANWSSTPQPPVRPRTERGCFSGCQEPSSGPTRTRAPSLVGGQRITDTLVALAFGWSNTVDNRRSSGSYQASSASSPCGRPRGSRLPRSR